MSPMPGALMCERCDARPARGQVCPGDGRYHHHGRVHTVTDGLELVCDACRQTIADEWTAHRLLNSVERKARR